MTKSQGRRARSRAVTDAALTSAAGVAGSGPAPNRQSVRVRRAETIAELQGFRRWAGMAGAGGPVTAANWSRRTRAAI
ncbi:hypothetical protein [Nocardia noduli]|uniref:hypothetical protein n=1 Tax=Nocardia noduli TaxID=2815722 RepID=UPI001C23CB19|nr:hypothetical protein [Nocardia noduli]